MMTTATTKKTTTTNKHFTWQPTHTLARISSYRSEKFRPETAAILITHFMHKMSLTLPPYVFCSCWY